MILYTEAQLQHAYIGFVREIYEEDMLDKFLEDQDGS